MKRKKLVKKALKHPELYTPAELAYFKRWLWQKKQDKKAAKIQLKQEANS
jgi:hypothetical protein